MFELFIMALFLYSLENSLDVINAVEALLGCRKCLTSWISKLSLPKRHQQTFYKSSNRLKIEQHFILFQVGYGPLLLWQMNMVMYPATRCLYSEWAQANFRRFLCPKPRINFAIFLSIRTVTLWWLNWEYHTLLNRGKNTKGSTSNSNAIIWWHVLFPSTYADRGRRPFLSEK